MLHCDQCGTDLIDGTCPHGHDATDPSVVVPAGASGSGVESDGAGRAKVISLGPSYAGPGSALSEALETLASAAEPAVAPPEAPAGPEPTPLEAVTQPGSIAPEPERFEPPTAVEQPIEQPVEQPIEPEPEVVSFDLGQPTDALDEPSSEDESPVEEAESAQPAAAVGAVGGDLIAKPVARASGNGRSRKLLVVPLVLALLGGAGVFFVFGSSGTAEAAVYRRVFTPKESHTYRFSMSMNGVVEAGPATERMDVSMGMTVTERTLGVDGDGIATIRQSIDRAEMSVNGERVPIPQLDGMTITVRMAPDGRVLAVEGLGAFGLGDTGPIGELMGPNSMGPLLPSDAVAPGDEWTVKQDLPSPLIDGSLSMTARNRLVERRLDNGVETALIRSELDMPMNLKISMRKLLEMAEEAAGTSMPDAGVPKKAVFVYEGGMTMDLLQTVELPTSRPVRITGDGEADLRMKIEGIPGGMPEMRMRMTMKVSMIEVESATRPTSSAFAPDPLLDA